MVDLNLRHLVKIYVRWRCGFPVGHRDPPCYQQTDADNPPCCVSDGASVNIGEYTPQKLRNSHCCVPFTATFSKRRKIGSLWSERCDARHKVQAKKQQCKICLSGALSHVPGKSILHNDLHILRPETMLLERGLAGELQNAFGDAAVLSACIPEWTKKTFRVIYA